MKDKYILTAESVTAGHPDKLCDTIADSILDACLKEDSNARVACEVLATAGKILVAGELRTTASPDVETIVRQTVQRAGYDCNYHVEVRLHTQSPDIADAVDGETLGAGDQGIIYGYACWETVELLPAPVVLANRITSLLTTCREEKLISGIGPDGKAQVSVQYAFGVPERVDTIVISCQHDADKDPDELREELRRLVIARACHDVRIDEQTKILINPSGRFVLGGFDADTGLTGRKLMVDTYGGLAPQKGRFRQQAEYIVWGSNGDMPVSRPVPCLPGVFKYGNPQNRIHLTEKPLQLMQDLVKITEPGGHILDPFAGSGTTVLAAVKEGYDATGIEVTDVYADLARKRLEAELNAA